MIAVTSAGRGDVPALALVVLTDVGEELAVEVLDEWEATDLAERLVTAVTNLVAFKTLVSGAHGD